MSLTEPDYMHEPLEPPPPAERPIRIKRLRDAIETGDTAEVIAIGLEANEHAFYGIYCTCAQPLVTGLETLCYGCGLTNETQLARRQEAAEEPHRFQPIQGFKSMCVLCRAGGSDPVHA